MARFFRFFILFLSFSYLLVGSASITDAKPSSKSERLPKVLGISCAIGLVVLVGHVVSIGKVTEQAAIDAKRADEKAVADERKENEAVKRDLENQVASLSDDELKALKKTWLAETLTYEEYLNRAFDHLRLSAVVRSKIKENVRALLKNSDLSFSDYQASTLLVADKLFIYSVQLTAIRAEQTANMQLSNELFEAGVVAAILDFFVDDSHTDDLDFARAEIKRAAWETRFDIVKAFLSKPVIERKASVLLGTEKGARKLGGLNPFSKDDAAEGETESVDSDG